MVTWTNFCAHICVQRLQWVLTTMWWPSMRRKAKTGSRSMSWVSTVDGSQVHLPLSANSGLNTNRGETWHVGEHTSRENVGVDPDKGADPGFFFSLSLYCERVFFNFFINFSGIYKLLQFEADPRSGFLDQVWYIIRLHWVKWDWWDLAEVCTLLGAILVCTALHHVSILWHLKIMINLSSLMINNHAHRHWLGPRV